MGKSDAERKAAERERMREAGFVLRQVWVHPRDWQRAKVYLQQLRNRRESKP